MPASHAADKGTIDMVAPSASKQDFIRRQSVKMPKKKDLRGASQDYARKQTALTFTGSSIPDRSNEFPKFTKEEVKLGKVLGKGGFGTVYECKAFDAGQTNGLTKKGASSKKGGDDDEVEGEMESRLFIAQHCTRDSGECRYAIKFLSPEVIEDAAQFLQGIMDMAVETRVLSAFEHPNIVKLRAIAQCDPFQPEYFIVMDRLSETLEKRLIKWEGRDKRSKGLGKLMDRKGKKKNDLMEERLTAAFDLSAALEYMHGKNVIYRDLKPENVGFDIRGDIKIFDFGLAKELRAKDKVGDLYKLTGYTGSPRYMAPEVALSKPYNSSCDVYSFAILLWEMLSLKRPFELYTAKSMQAKVWGGEFKRPFVPADWAVPIKLLLAKCWGNDLEERYKMENVTKILRKECVRIRDGDDSGLEHQRRRSTFVFRKKK